MGIFCHNLKYFALNRSRYFQEKPTQHFENKHKKNNFTRLHGFC